MATVRERGRVRASGPTARQAALSLALIGASLAHARPARAELELHWDAPPSCPQQDEVFERIKKLAGPALEQTERLSVEGSISPANGRFRLTLVVRSSEGERNRVIASDSCADLAGAAAITVALLLGVDASTLEDAANGTQGTGGSGTDTSKQAAAAASAKPPEQPKPPPVEKKPPTKKDDAAEWAVLLRAPLAALDIGPLPRPAFSFGLGGGARYGAWRFVLTGRASLKQSVDASAAGATFGADLMRLTGELFTCRGFRSLDFEVAPCVGLALEHLNARGFGEGISPSSQRATWLAPGAGVVGHWYALESLAFYVGVTGYVELSRPRLVVQGLGEVAQLSPVALSTTIGAEWIL